MKYEEAEVNKSAIMQDFQENKKKQLKMSDCGLFWILLLRNLSWVIIV